MSDSPSEKTEGVVASGDSSVVIYRCVCGESLSLDPIVGGSCPVCDRCFSPEAVRAASAETVNLESLGDSPKFSVSTPDQDVSDPRIGKVLDHFRIVSCLGHGGMGTVYRALDESLQRYVALKVIRTDEGNSEEDHVQRLVREARAQARVSHPNVVHIYFVGRDEDSAFFAMELISGPTLEERLKSGPLPYDDVVHLALEMVKALEYAANFDIVHGDIKPSNILIKPGNVPLNESRTVKLSDFGLAQRISYPSESGMRIVGTPNYLSPEAADGQMRDIRSDMYSLGVTLFEMTFGRLPYDFGDSSIQDRLKMHQEVAVEFPDPWPTTVPDGWRTVLARLLAKRPQDRYGDYRELSADLTSIQPVPRPRAGRGPRAFAWLVDLALANTALQVLHTPFESILRTQTDQTGMRVLAALATFSVPMLASILQARRGTTPGKKVFQIRIVDQHGLRPSNATLGLRMVVQMLPIWGIVVANLVLAISSPLIGLNIGYGIGGVALGILGIDALVCLFHPKSRSLSDLLFGTHVDLDT